MKTIISSLITVSIFLLHTQVFGQPSLTLGGGYAFGKFEDGGPNVTGFKASVGVQQVLDDHWGIGAALSYLALTEEEGTVTTRFRAVPILFVPKFLFGEGNLKGYVKGGLGLQNSRFQFDGLLLGSEDWDFGFAAGGGAGVNYTVSDKLFLNLDYEYLWLKNNTYKEASSNAITFGLGFFLAD